MSDTKLCATCGVRKQVASFPGDGRGPRPHCTQCFNANRQGRGALKKQAHGREPTAKSVMESLPPVIEHRLKQRVTELEAKNRSLIADLSDAQRMNEFAKQVANTNVRPITIRERSSRLREATALVLASDWHVEESVEPEQVSGRNRYNLDIAKRRMERFFERVRWSLDLNRQAFLVRDLVLWLGGDIITGFLHDDNRESNLLSPVRAIAFAQAHITAGIEHLLKDPKLERIVVKCNDGNHGRLTEKTRSATRVANSIEWLLYTNLALAFKNEPRIQFSIAQGEHLYYEVYGRTIRFTHGDTVRYGGGVGGVTVPLYKALARWDTIRRADLTAVGHFHQLTSLSDLVINGSLIGYSPYAMTIGARYEPPAQAFCMLDPVRFKSVSIPLWVSEAADDQRRVA